MKLISTASSRAPVETHAARTTSRGMVLDPRWAQVNAAPSSVMSSSHA